MRFVKPLDEDVLSSIGTHYKKIVTIEDHAIKGGARQCRQ